MRLYYRSLLAVVALLTTATAALVGDNDENKILGATNADLPVVPRVLTVNERDAPVPRFLRAVPVVDEDERAFGIPSMSTITETAMKIPGASTVVRVAKNLPGASIVGDLAQKLQYQYWLKMNKTPVEVKTILGLDNLGVKILDNPNLDTWVRFAVAYNKRNNLPESTIISDLLKMMPADRVMMLSEKLPVSAKTIDNVKYYILLYMNKTPSDFYKILRLDTLGKELPGGLAAYEWLRFKKLYDKHHGIANAS